LFAQAVEALQHFVHVRLIRPAADLGLELIDRALQRLLPVFDGSLELPAQVRRYTALSLTKSLSARYDSSAYEP
jgi:hypothetical protein